MYTICQSRDCEKEIPNPKPNKRYCSIKCREFEKGRRYRDKNKRIKKPYRSKGNLKNMYIICQARNCNNVISDPKPNKRFCSSKCRQYESVKRLRDKHERMGLCPVCGKEWVDPKHVYFNKPKYCRNCQIERMKH